MKLPEKFYKSLILISLAILIAYLLSPFVFSSEPDLSEILTKGPSISQKTEHVQMVIKWFFALFAAFATVKGYEYWQTINHRRSSPMSNNSKDIPQDVKKYKETLNTISSLPAKSDPPKFMNRRKKKKINRKKSARFSSKQTKKIMDSSRFLSEFMVDE